MVLSISSTLAHVPDSLLRDCTGPPALCSALLHCPLNNSEAGPCLPSVGAQWQGSTGAQARPAASYPCSTDSSNKPDLESPVCSGTSCSSLALTQQKEACSSRCSKRASDKLRNAKEGTKEGITNLVHFSESYGVQTLALSFLSCPKSDNTENLSRPALSTVAVRIRQLRARFGMASSAHPRLTE